MHSSLLHVHSPRSFSSTAIAFTVASWRIATVLQAHSYSYTFPVHNVIGGATMVIMPNQHS